MNGSIDDMIQRLHDYKKSLKAKADLLVKTLAEAGAEAVRITYGAWPYRGPKDFEVSVEERGPGSYAIVASGQTVLILEFGAGVTYSATQHPMAADFGYGPGTYPGQIHAMDKRGWYLPKAAGGGHTYGNPPNAAMYYTAKSLREVIEQAAREVFNN